MTFSVTDEVVYAIPEFIKREREREKREKWCSQ